MRALYFCAGFLCLALLQVAVALVFSPQPAENPFGAVERKVIFRIVAPKGYEIAKVAYRCTPEERVR